MTTVDVLPDPAIRQELSAVSGWPTIPQVFVKGELVGGADITQELGETGELRTILEEKLGAVTATAPRNTSSTCSAALAPDPGPAPADRRKAPTAVSVCSSASLLGPPSQRWRYGTRSNARSS